MKDFFGIRIYTGHSLWGWRMVGIGWKTKWFIGFSINKEVKK